MGDGESRNKRTGRRQGVGKAKINWQRYINMFKPPGAVNFGKTPDVNRGRVRGSLMGMGIRVADNK
jgi:hypothetical protein